MPDSIDSISIAVANYLELIEHAHTGGHFRAYLVGTIAFSKVITSQVNTRQQKLILSVTVDSNVISVAATL